jgi:exonuclease III
MRVVTWNCHRANHKSPAWDYLLELAPDIALLQEVGGIPLSVSSQYACENVSAIWKTGSQQRFGTALLVKGIVESPIHLPAPTDWVAKELKTFSGNLVARHLRLDSGQLLKVISVYNPAWSVPRERLQGIDTTGVHLEQNHDVWIEDLLWASLKELQPEPGQPWIVGGDFNLSETFDMGPRGPRGNREYLDRMAKLGLVECLRHSKGVLTPTFRYARNNSLIHQIDHLFVTETLARNLVSCNTGAQERVFDMGLSDHLPIIADFHLV